MLIALTFLCCVVMLWLSSVCFELASIEEQTTFKILSFTLGLLFSVVGVLFAWVLTHLALGAEPVEILSWLL